MQLGNNGAAGPSDPPRFPLGEALRRAGDRSQVRVRHTERQIQRVMAGARNDVIAAVTSAVSDGWDASRISHRLHTTVGAAIARAIGSAGAAVLELTNDAVVADTRAHEVEAAHEVRRVVPWLNIEATDGGPVEAARIRRDAALAGEVHKRTATGTVDLLGRVQAAVWKAGNVVDFLRLVEVVVEDIERQAVKSYVLTMAAAVGGQHRRTIGQILGAYAEGARRIAVDQYQG